MAEVLVGDPGGVAATLDGPLPDVAPGEGSAGPLRRFPEQAVYEASVRRAQEHIRAGDAFQIVLSQRAERPTSASPLAVYRALRRVNPSPYLFLLELDGIALVGSSPETLVKCDGRRASLNPIAGTTTPGDGDAERLLASEKDRAEHVMLVDLGRNDLSRVCRAGSVRVERFMEAERFSHVTHLVSEVVGELQQGVGPFDLLRATFPAGTVSGAPKVRAMQIISELEGTGAGRTPARSATRCRTGRWTPASPSARSCCRTGSHTSRPARASSPTATRRQSTANASASSPRSRRRSTSPNGRAPVILLVDNYDSFTYNLAHLFGELGAEVVVRRNDAIDADEAERLAPSHLVISPGPGRPGDAGASIEILRRLGPTTPTLGVCLGHQAIVEAFGGEVGQARELVHGKATEVTHDGRGVFVGLPERFAVGRYHSLAATRIPDVLEITSHAADGEVMGVRHRELPIEGVQFHPESVLTPDGPALARNFLEAKP